MPRRLAGRGSPVERRWLESFVVVAEEQHFARAAAADLLIEAATEREELKIALFRQPTPQPDPVG